MMSLPANCLVSGRIAPVFLLFGKSFESLLTNGMEHIARWCFDAIRDAHPAGIETQHRAQDAAAFDQWNPCNNPALANQKIEHEEGCAMLAAVIASPSLHYDRIDHVSARV
jgi:hypothetical protein